MSNSNDVFEKMIHIAPNKLELTDGSRIVVIGGGPARSFFTFSALDIARRMDLDISVDIVVAKALEK